MAIERLKKLRFSLLLLLLFFSTLFASIVLLHEAAQNAAFFSQWYSLLFFLNGICLVALIGLIGISLHRLIRQVRQQEMGARLTTKLVVTLIFLAVLPAAFMYAISLSFLQRGVDSWFDNHIETTLSDALDLSRTALDERMRDIELQMGTIGKDLLSHDSDNIQNAFTQLKGDLAQEFRSLNLFNESGAALKGSAILPESVRLHLLNNNAYVALEPVEEGVSIEAAVRLSKASQNFILFGSIPVTERMGILAERIQEAFTTYKGLIYVREPLKNSFILTLSLALLQTLLTAIWAAFYFAQRIVAPIRMLAIGTRAVAVGNYRQQLPQQSNDELGMLVQSFNDMTRRIGSAQEEAQHNQQKAETQKLYFETVLRHLSSGVITFDANRRLRTANTAAQNILGIALDDIRTTTIEELSRRYRFIRPLWQKALQHLNEGDRHWQEEITLTLNEATCVLMCRGSQLPSDEQIRGGYILVFDDITRVIQAKKDAAWSEVARRLAHEIKNPLTPIQLSAERLRHKYLNKLSKEDAEVLNKSTNTIINQVESMKGLVSAFTNYAKSPKVDLHPVDVNTLVREVTELYKNLRDVKLELKLSDERLCIMGDEDRVRQLLHNLFKNAIEATRDNQGHYVFITTRLNPERPQRSVELLVEDQGSGIAEDMLNKLYEPYVTSKTKGTGLGLAIAKKIIEEHSGDIRAYNLAGGGAQFVMHFPRHNQSSSSKQTGT